MSGNGLNREGFLAARDTIAALKGTVECLQVNLSQERDANEGLNLTIESLRGENGSLQEKTFQLEAELDALKQEMKDEKNQKNRILQCRNQRFAGSWKRSWVSIIRI